MPKEKKVKLNEAQERVNFILSRALKMETAKNEYSRRWKEYDAIWKLWEEERTGEDSWRETLPDTWIFATVKTAQAAFIDSKVSPIFLRHEDEDQLKPKDLADLYADISDKGDLDVELYYARLDAFKFGVGFLKTVYVKDSRTVFSIQKFDPDKPEDEAFTWKEKEINDFDDPKTQRVSPWMMLIDEMARADWNTARDCIEIEVLGYEDARAKYGHLVKNWNKIPKAGGLRINRQIAETQIAQTADTNTGETRAETIRFFAPFELADDWVEILHYWSKHDVSGTYKGDSYEIIINGEPVRVKTSKNPAPMPYIHKQLPYTPLPYSPRSGDEFWPMGIIEIGKADARALKKYREMMSDRQKLSLFSPAFSDANDEIDQRLLKLKPLSIIRTRGGAPKQFQIPGITNADLSLAQNFENSFKRAVGIDERVLGISPEKTRLTATEIELLRDGALRRLREFAFLFRKAMLREIKLKMMLFKQYYASPFKADEHIRQDGVKRIKVAARRFKVKISENVYREKDVPINFFEGDIDVDIDMRLLVPMTQAEMVAKWAQVLRDTTPFIQAGIIDWSIEKILNRYVESLEVNINQLKRDEESEALVMAEAEHRLFADQNTSRVMLEKILPDGTPPEYLNATHLRRHQELLETDDKIEPNELRNLVEHIALDMRNFMALRQQQQMLVPPQALQQIGGVAPQLPAPQPMAQPTIPEQSLTPVV